MAFRVEVDGLAELQAAAAAAKNGLDQEVEAALLDAARIVATSAARRAPRRSGRMAASVEAFSEGATVAGVRVTARKRSRGYPGGYPYPQKIERSEPFLAPAMRQEGPQVEKQLTEVLDDIARRWGS